MPGRTLQRAVILVAALSIAASGCGGTTPSGAEGTRGASASGSPPSSGPSTSAARTAAVSQPPLPAAQKIEQVVYFLEGDSTGTKTGADTTIALLFEPGGGAVLYAESPTDHLGHHGTWRYEDGRLALKFASEDFKADASFALSLDDTSVTMPFPVFDVGSGTSEWKRGSLSVITRAAVVFAANGSDPDRGVSPDGAIEEALAVARSAIGSDAPDVDVLPLAGAAVPPDDRLARVGGGVPEAPRAFEPAGPKVTDVTRTANGLHVEYEGRPSVEVALFDFTEPSAAPSKLTPGPIAGDPRVRLDPEPSGHSDDPKNRTAAFIVPFDLQRYPGGLWTAFLPDGTVTWLGSNPGTVGRIVSFDWEGKKRKLEGLGYEVATAIYEDATLVGIVEALGGPAGPAPGVIMVQTHGGENGSLLTGVDLGSWRDWDGVDAAFAAAVGEVTAIAPDFATFEGGTEKEPSTVELVGRPFSNNGGAFHGGRFFLGLRPAFWRWLASHNGGFHDSLVFIGACLTDARPNLRESIQAKAYFAWTEKISGQLDAAVMNYVVDALVRPTHTAEEAYYNVVRVFATGQRIYDEDSDLEPAYGKPFAKGAAFMDLLHGYGWNGSKLVPYATSGWLDRGMNPGNVWWLVFTGRWDKKAGDGAYALVKCWDNYWGKDERPGLRDAFCNAASPGGKPSPDEVAYATFVLTGKQAMPYSRTPVPRFTLADSLD